MLTIFSRGRGEIALKQWNRLLHELSLLGHVREIYLKPLGNETMTREFGHGATWQACVHPFFEPREQQKSYYVVLHGSNSLQMLDICDIE